MELSHKEITKSVRNVYLRSKLQNRKRGRPNMRWIDSIKEAIDMCLQDLSRAVENRTLWSLLIHRVTRS